MQEVMERQGAELAQAAARNSDLQHAAVEREAAVQDLWVLLEAQRAELAVERERCSQTTVELATALQQLEVRMPL